MEPASSRLRAIDLFMSTPARSTTLGRWSDAAIGHRNRYAGHERRKRLLQTRAGHPGGDRSPGPHADERAGEERRRDVPADALAVNEMTGHGAAADDSDREQRGRDDG